MFFELSVYINRPPIDVFAFLRDKHEYPQEPGASVLSLDKLTKQPVIYRQQMLPAITSRG